MQIEIKFGTIRGLQGTVTFGGPESVQDKMPVDMPCHSLRTHPAFQG